MLNINDFFSHPSPDLFNEEIELFLKDIYFYINQSRDISSSKEISLIIEQFKSSLIPDESTDPRDYFKFISENIIEDSIKISSPLFIGHMTSKLPDFILPLMLVMVMLNKNLVKTETARVLTYLERQTLAMIHRLIYQKTPRFYDNNIQNPKSTLGMVTSGGTVANMTALWCARNQALYSNCGVDQEGLVQAIQFHNLSQLKIIGSDLMHYSFDKAADLLGIGVKNLIKIPVDHKGRIKLDLLQDAISECHSRNELIISLVGVAGATETGSIDPLLEMAKIAQKHKIFFHVDAAWGGPTLFSKKNKKLFQGIELADSVTVDGHKQLYLPMGIGLLLLKDPSLAQKIEKTSDYIIRSDSDDLGKRTLEGSRSAMALLLHGSLNILGSKGYEALIENGIKNAQLMANTINKRKEFELLMQPQLNIVNYRYIPLKFINKYQEKQLSFEENKTINQLNIDIQKEQFKRGKSFVSRTTLMLDNYSVKRPIIALRAVLANPITRQNDINQMLDEQVSIGKELEK